ncbi:hypothetical protein C8J56DRAFT_1133773 [Mycena floridula]|nr:hypothetical protein C8J56DRAFT_1133773 [Mycena floridula]
MTCHAVNLGCAVLKQLAQNHHLQSMGSMEIVAQNNTFGTIVGDNFSHNRITIINHNPPPATRARARGYMPAPRDKLFGRDNDIQEIVRILTMKLASDSKRVRFALLGAGGQGKTELALKVMAYPAMRRCYSKKNGIWVPCEKASSPELLLDVLFTSLTVIRDTHNTIQDILDELGETSDPIILLLDNFETQWNAPGARGEVEQILQDISQFSHVALFITMRATVPPFEDIDWEEMNIQPLNPDASLQLFVSIHPESRDDVKLSELLKMLGHMALAVKLMARYAKNTGFTVKELIANYGNTSTAMAMLGSAQGSESSLVKNELNAARLLQMIAMLPSGTSPETLQQWWAQNLENLNGALRVLLEQYNSVDQGEKCFQDDMQAHAIEEINLQAVLLQTSESNLDVIEALETLAWHQYHVRPHTEVIQHAVKLLQNVTDQNQLVGTWQKSLQQHCLSWDAYLAAPEPILAAKALIDIANLSAFIDPSFNEILLLEQAQQELKSIDEDDHHLRQLDKAEQWALLAVSEWKHIQGYLGGSFWLLGRIYISKAEYDKAIRSLEEGLQSAKTLGDQWDTANILLELGWIYMKKGQNNDAKKKLEGVEGNKIVCQYYLDKLDNPSRVPTSDEERALKRTEHKEDIPEPPDTVIFSAV